MFLNLFWLAAPRLRTTGLIRETYECLRFSATETGLAIVAGPACAHELVGKIADVDPAEGMNGLAALAAGDQGFLFLNPIALIRAQTIDTYW